MMQPLAKGWCKKNAENAYVWYFDRNLPGDDNGAWHSSDLWYWFGTLKNCWRPMEEKDDKLSGEMMQYLCNFAARGDPNGPDLAQWMPTGSGQKQVMMMGEEVSHLGKPPIMKLIRIMLTNKAVGE
jgi:para-nitrobenzyl esterase